MIICEPTVRLVSVVIAEPLTRVMTVLVEPSMVKVTVPVGIPEVAVTEAEIVTLCPKTGWAGEKAPRVMVAVGAVVCPVRTS